MIWHVCPHYSRQRSCCKASCLLRLSLLQHRHLIPGLYSPQGVCSPPNTITIAEQPLQGAGGVTLFTALGSAPPASSKHIQDSSICLIARCSGVLPSYHTLSYTALSVAALHLPYHSVGIGPRLQEHQSTRWLAIKHCDKQCRGSTLTTSREQGSETEHVLGD